MAGLCRRSGKTITRLRDMLGDPQSLQKAVLVHGSRTILASRKTKEGERIILDMLDPGGQQVMWIYLDTLREELEQSILQDIHSQTRQAQSSSTLIK